MSKEARTDDQHVVARLESFSDIVIGFSLAQSAINLVVTGSVESFFRHPWGIFAYLITFFLVARMWWTHSKIMHTYFEPRPVMIVLNFIALAALGLMVFSLQLWMHRGDDLAGQLLALKFYFICFSATMGTTAVIRVLGVRFRWAHLSPEQRRTGLRISTSTLIVSAFIVAGVLLPSADERIFGFDITPFPANLLYALVIGAITARGLRAVTANSRWGESDVEAAQRA